MIIKGKISYQDLETGIWSIVDHSGNRWVPINMPDQLKIDKADVEVRANRADVEGIAMNGQYIEITGFHTIPKF